jgi:hypothetical protein
MPPTSAKAPNDADELVPDPQVQREFGIDAMTLYRWTNDPALGFPTKIQIRGRNFRSRKQLEAFKALMLQQALKQARHSPQVTPARRRGGSQRGRKGFQPLEA